jgi:hypothetical protein
MPGTGTSLGLELGKFPTEIILMTILVMLGGSFCDLRSRWHIDVLRTCVLAA